MNVMSRGVRNAFRNMIRTFSIVVILGLSIGLSLSMLAARQAVQTKINSVKSSIGNTISISPAGSRGFAGGGEPLTTDQLKQVAAVSNVVKVSDSLSDRLTSDSSNLVSAIEPGTLGNRQAGNSGVGFQGPPPDAGDRAGGQAGGTRITRTFTPPVIVTGVNDLSDPSAYGGSSVSYTAGQALDASKDTNTAVVGKALATKNNLAVGSTFTAYGQTVTVVGIYDAGNEFANAGLIMPLASLQRLSSQASDVTSATVTVNSIDNMDGAVAAIKSALGDKADVVSTQDSAKTAIAPLENVKTISLYSLIGALVAGAVIILLTMVMIVRERRREIGVMKAIGASNLTTMFQFVAEALTLTLLGMIVGLVIGAAAASPITRVLVDNSTTSQTQSQTADAPGAVRVRGTGGGRALRTFGSNSVTSVRNVQTSVGWSMLVYGFLAALIIAIIGSALPALFISKISPAEVMRAE